MKCQKGSFYYTIILIFFVLNISVGCVDRDDSLNVKTSFAVSEFSYDTDIEKEGKLGATAMVIEGGGTKLCIVSCDVVCLPREIVDEICIKLENELGIPVDNILISATHTHSGPSINDPALISALNDAVFSAVSKANDLLQTSNKSEMYFWLGQEATVGQNSRLLLSDSTIYWYGRKSDAIRPTGTFDPELPLIVFKSGDDILGVLFNHSTHNIGARKSGVLSPAFYGLASQELEEEFGGKFLFLLGAAGSVHDFNLTTDEKVFRIKEAVKDAFGKAQKRDITKIASKKVEFEYRVKEFDDEAEELAVSSYCRKRLGNLSFADLWTGGSWDPDPESTIASFRKRRKELEPHQGEVRKTPLQVMVIGDIAMVGIGGELFNDLGLDIKRRSPYRYTYIVTMANDAIGYIPDKKGFELGGYQLWSNLEDGRVSKGTGEAVADRVVQLLYEIYNEQ